MGRLVINRSLKRSGLFFAGFCALSAVYNVFQQVFQYHHQFPGFLLHSHALINLGVAGIFALSAFVPRLVWIQPIVIFAYVPEPLLTPERTFTSLGIFAIGMMLLYRLGFFEKRPLPRLILCLAYLYGWVLYGVTRAEGNIMKSFSPIIFMTFFLVVTYLVFQDKLAIYLKEPKPKLSLKGKGLSEAERSYIRSLSDGKSSKEIAFAYEVTESTVRNTLARAYKKLEIEDKAGLAALAEKYEITD
jgi:DNA-binding CsgD family transcriptional regulator